LQQGAAPEEKSCKIKWNSTKNFNSAIENCNFNLQQKLKIAITEVQLKLEIAIINWEVASKVKFYKEIKFATKEFQFSNWELQFQLATRTKNCNNRIPTEICNLQ
jgi:hypothetical protein